MAKSQKMSVVARHKHGCREAHVKAPFARVGSWRCNELPEYLDQGAIAFFFLHELYMTAVIPKMQIETN